jgi:hypothetical protein
MIYNVENLYFMGFVMDTEYGLKYLHYLSAIKQLAVPASSNGLKCGIGVSAK